MKKILSSPFFAAVVGGAIVAAVMLIAGIGNTTTETIVEQGSSGANAFLGTNPVRSALATRGAAARCPAATTTLAAASRPGPNPR